MGILTGLYQDVVNIDDADGARVHTEVNGAILPPKQGAVVNTPAGPMPLLNPLFLLPPTLTIPTNGAVTVVTSGIWTVGDIFRVQGEAQKQADPMNPATAHHWQAELVKEQH